MEVQPFRVLTEFRFDVGRALINSEKLQGGVDKLAGAADNAKLAFESLSAGIVGSFSLSQFGLLSTLKEAITVTDNFNESALGFSQIMAHNMNYLQGDIGNFNQRLMTSKDLISDIGDFAGKSGLSKSAMIRSTQVIAANLIPHGMAGVGFGNAQKLAGGGLEVSKALGIAGKDMGKEIASILGAKEGTAPTGDLFSALVGSTKTFAEFNKDATDFTDLPLKDRMQLLNKGLRELKDNLGTTGTEMVTLADFTDHLKDVLYGLGGILQPIGDAILPVLENSLKELTTQFETVGKALGKQAGDFLQDVLKHPKELLINLGALSNIGKDFSLSKKIFEVFFAIETGLKVLRFFKIGSGFTIGGFLFDAFKFALKKVGAEVLAFAGSLSFAGVFSGLAFAGRALMFVLNGLAFVIGEILFPIAIMTSVFQGIRRAWEGAQLAQAVRFAALLPKIAEIMQRASNAIINFLNPFFMVGEGFRMMLQPIFEWILSVDDLVDVGDAFVGILEMIGQAMVLAMATVNGFVAAIFSMIDNLSKGNFSGLGGGAVHAFDQGIDDYIEKNMKGVQNGKGVSNKITNNNIGKVEIRNDFKENVEPDRIAFTMKDQILKAAQNPKQARGRSLQSAYGAT